MLAYMMFVHGSPHPLPCWLSNSAAPAAPLPVAHRFEEDGAVSCMSPPANSDPVTPAGLHLGHILPQCLQCYAWTGACSLDCQLQPNLPCPAATCCPLCRCCSPPLPCCRSCSPTLPCRRSCSPLPPCQLKPPLAASLAKCQDLHARSCSVATVLPLLPAGHGPSGRRAWHTSCESTITRTRL